MINATLLLQVINFWITYFVLKKVILAPGYRLIEQREQERLVMQRTMKTTSALLTELAHQKQQEWQKFHQKNHIIIPAQEQIPGIKLPVLSFTPLQDQHEKNIIKSIAGHIIAKVLS